MVPKNKFRLTVFLKKIFKFTTGKNKDRISVNDRVREGGQV